MKEKMQQRQFQISQLEVESEKVIQSPDQPWEQLPQIVTATPAIQKIVMGEKAVFSQRSQSTIAHHYGRLMPHSSPTGVKVKKKGK